MEVKKEEKEKMEVKKEEPRFEIIKEIGHGTFCNVYEAKDTKRGTTVALKMESNHKMSQKFLEHEYKVLTNIIGHKGIPKAFGLSRWNGKSQLSMELLGPSVSSLFSLAHGKISSCSLMMIACQMLETLKHVHDAGYIHGDVKPQNILTGRHAEDSLFLIDYGLSGRYREPNGDHIPYQEKGYSSLIGTPRYCSLHTHAKEPRSRRDDLESLAYVLIELGAGSLPWSGVSGNTAKEKYDNIAAVKKEATFVNISKLLPSEVFEFFTYARGLSFTETPEYQKWIELFYARMCTLQPNMFAPPPKFRWCWSNTFKHDEHVSKLNSRIRALEHELSQLKGLAPVTTSIASSSKGSREKTDVQKLIIESMENAVVARELFFHVNRYARVGMPVHASRVHIYKRLGLPLAMGKKHEEVKAQTSNPSSSTDTAPQKRKSSEGEEPEEETVKRSLQLKS